MRILITGATGFLGKEIGLELYRRGHELFVVSRDQKKARLLLPFPCQVIEGDLGQGILKSNHLSSVDAVLNLMGESVASSRWTISQKSKIFNSRIIGTRNLVNSFVKAPSVFISASAIGFYGDAGEEELTERAQPGKDFLADVCLGWEKEVDDMAQINGNCRIVKCRLGAVLSPQGGALEKMLPLFKAGLGGKLGSGKQWMSWIHIQDAIHLFVEAIENSQYEGVINFSSPEPKTNEDFSRELAQTLNRSLGPAVPKLALKTLLGEMSQIVLASQKVIPQRALQLGYHFKFPALKSALEDLLKYHRGEDIYETKQYLPQKPDEVFEFFSQAQNLERITPDDLKFHIVEVSTPQIQQGTVIDYKLKIQGVPVEWRTLIEKWDPPYSFVDSALKGPYKSWHHTHTFEKLGDGTLVTDHVRYVLPLGRIGWLAGYKKVSSDISKIFDFRRGAVAEVFKIR